MMKAFNLTHVLVDSNDLCLFQEFTMHDTIGCYIDLDKWQLSFSKNGKACFLFKPLYWF